MDFTIGRFIGILLRLNPEPIRGIFYARKKGEEWSSAKIRTNGV